MTSRLDIVVFTHNHEAFIERALSSVLSQETSFDIHLRINDDASTDNTIGVIREVLSDSPISWQLTESPENRFIHGISFLHEFAAESRSEFIAILDGDDFWTDDHKLQRQVDLLDRFPEAALCHHPLLEYAAGELTPIAWPPFDYRREIIPGSMLTVQNVISTSSVVLRTAMFPKKMPEGFNGLRIGDYPMWSLTTAGKNIAFVDRPMAAYRIHESNIWASLSAEERFDRELEARIYICNNVAEDMRTEWRLGIVDAVSGHLRLDNLAERLAVAEHERQVLADELSSAERSYQQILASTSWRLTKPLRAIMSATKRTAKA